MLLVENIVEYFYEHIHYIREKFLNNKIFKNHKIKNLKINSIRIATLKLIDQILVSRINKELLQINKKTQTSQSKISKGYEWPNHGRGNDLKTYKNGAQPYK